MSAELFPAFKAGCFGEGRPVVVIDTREQTPLTFKNLTTEPGTLTTGDYSFRGGETLFSVERKSITDIVGCCVGDNRDRFERELIRLRGYQFKRLLIVGDKQEIEDHNYRSRILPKAVLSTISAFEVRYDTPVVWKATPTAAAVQVESWVWWFSREILKSANQLVAAIVNKDQTP